MTPDDFISRWKSTSLSERSAAQSHFIELCHLLGVQSPTEADPQGNFYTFEKHTGKDSGRKGFADVWYKEHFAWEYKKPNGDLEKALNQLRQYSGALGNPPLLVVSDRLVIRVIPQFTGYVTTPFEITIEQLKDPKKLQILRNLWLNPEALKPQQSRNAVTEVVAERFSELAERIRSRGIDPHQVAQFLIRILFCLFAESIGLLPKKLFSNILESCWNNPNDANESIADIFGKMAKGGMLGTTRIRHFNGDLFKDSKDEILQLRREEWNVLYHTSAYDWSSISPTIFGTLFESGLDPKKRYGAHYTSEEDIKLVVEPVVMEPIRNKWIITRSELNELVTQPTLNSTTISSLVNEILEEICTTTILDPACGSGNFLYVTLKMLHDLEYEVITWCIENDVQSNIEIKVGPHQLQGMDINIYASELARAVIWIGQLQWMIEHGQESHDPILQRLDSIKDADALLDKEGYLISPWPKTTCIVGNPPFLGVRKMRNGLEDKYVDKLWQVYAGSVSRESDLVCYFVERARRHLENQQVQRVGLITTSGITSQANRKVLERIKATMANSLNPAQYCDIFMAWTDRPWQLEGASIRIAILGFDNGIIKSRTLNGLPVDTINIDLTTGPNLTDAKRLKENVGISFQGINKGGPFEIDDETAQKMLSHNNNPNGRSNSDVIKRWIIGKDITDQSRNMWIIDFNDMPFEEAALYESPFEYVRNYVQPKRASNKRTHRKENWWKFSETAPKVRHAIAPLTRYIATSRVSKHRFFVWLEPHLLPDCRLIVIAKDDDYTFGILHSRAHQLWPRRTSRLHGVGNDPQYTPTESFEGFPFPNPSTSQFQIISQVAFKYNHLRQQRLEYSPTTSISTKRESLTDLYNTQPKPQWLVNITDELDKAVMDAYGWPFDLSDNDILSNLLAENLIRDSVDSTEPTYELIEGDDDI